MSEARDIVVLSTQYWDDSWFRKHQFAVRFHRDGHRVFYVEPTHSILRSRHVAGVGENPLAGTRVRTALEGPQVITTGRVLPFPRVSAVARANHALTLRRVRTELARRGSSGPLFLAYDARFADSLAPELADGRVVLDLVDDLSGYAQGSALRRRAAHDITTLCEHAARVVYTSPRLSEKYPACSASEVIPNGYDQALFHQDVAPRRVAPAGSPVIGFIGTLFSFLDFELLGAVADSLPHATLVLVGRAEEQEAVERLIARPNVVHLGYQPKEDIPSLVAGFDVCISPFLPGPVADAVSPLKLYEYLAMGRPVVCTPMAGVSADPVGEYVSFAADTRQFIAKVEGALSGAAEQPAELAEFIRGYSWDALYERFKALLGEELLTT